MTERCVVTQRVRTRSFIDKFSVGALTWSAVARVCQFGVRMTTEGEGYARLRGVTGQWLDSVRSAGLEIRRPRDLNLLALRP